MERYIEKSCANEEDNEVQVEEIVVKEPQDCEPGGDLQEGAESCDQKGHSYQLAVVLESKVDRNVAIEGRVHECAVTRPQDKRDWLNLEQWNHCKKVVQDSRYIDSTEGGYKALFKRLKKLVIEN